MTSLGVFADETGQRCLHVLTHLGERAWVGLYEKCKANLQSEYYQKGLTRASAWDDSTIEEDLDYVRNRFPDFDDLLHTVYERYGHERFSVTPDPLNVSYFARKFMHAVGGHETLQNGDYFGYKNPVDRQTLRRETVLQAVRDTFNEVYNSQHSSSSSVKLLSEVDADAITPDDSASQLGNRSVQKDATRTPLAVKTPSEVQSVAASEVRGPPPSKVHSAAGPASEVRGNAHNVATPSEVRVMLPPNQEQLSSMRARVTFANKRAEEAAAEALIASKALDAAEEMVLKLKRKNADSASTVSSRHDPPKIDTSQKLDSPGSSVQLRKS